MNRQHALVVGGTGMLADVSLWLVKKGYVVTVVGRRKEKYHQLLKRIDKPKFLSSIFVDYHQTEQLSEKLSMAVEKNGEFDVVVTWVHSSAPDAIPTIMNVQHSKNYDFFHVKGSSDYFEEDNEFQIPENCNYHEVYLGFKVVGDHTRWLTHQEISEGVKDSIHHKRKQTVVGQLEPWDMRPS
ncbi:hypothetical protein HNQ94_002614 [Salirhabdus euzebyi]|uniref:Short-chain dehydrogenase n=1 Tax=Salirhabdus euzebyi TaxID=394506 RepID=A0A841Q736_9BACI|nr:short-chain dehydrogenase [Salirhabdus euzebyi]MBB6454163.1 hypothetical protein [Salirhabdus euzebyi]